MNTIVAVNNINITRRFFVSSKNLYSNVFNNTSMLIINRNFIRPFVVNIKNLVVNITLPSIHNNVYYLVISGLTNTNVFNSLRIENRNINEVNPNDNIIVQIPIFNGGYIKESALSEQYNGPNMISQLDIKFVSDTGCILSNNDVEYYFTLELVEMN